MTRNSNYEIDQLNSLITNTNTSQFVNVNKNIESEKNINFISSSNLSVNGYSYDSYR